MRIGTFLACCALLVSTTFAATTRPSMNDAAMEKLGWRLGCQAYTFRSISLYETIDTLKELGIKYIELYPGQRLSKEQPKIKADHNMSPELVDGLIQKLKDSGVTAVNYGVVGLKDEAEAKKVFDFGKKLGMETIVSEPPGDMIKTIDKLCEEYSMKMAIHDHPKGPNSPYWNPDTVLAVVAGSSNRVGACADVGHWYKSELVPVDCIKKLEGRVISLHLKDRAKNMRDVPIGTGEVDMMGIFRELKKQGFKGVFSIEYETGSGDELVGNVVTCMEFFNKAATELAEEK